MNDITLYLTPSGSLLQGGVTHLLNASVPSGISLLPQLMLSISAHLGSEGHRTKWQPDTLFLEILQIKTIQILNENLFIPYIYVSLSSI